MPVSMRPFRIRLAVILKHRGTEIAEEVRRGILCVLCASVFFFSGLSPTRFWQCKLRLGDCSCSLVEFLEQRIEFGFELRVVPAGWVGFDVLEQFQGVVPFAAAM